MQTVVVGLVAWVGPESSSPTSATDAIKARLFLFGQCLINSFCEIAILLPISITGRIPRSTRSKVRLETPDASWSMFHRLEVAEVTGLVLFG